MTRAKAKQDVWRNCDKCNRFRSCTYFKKEYFCDDCLNFDEVKPELQYYKNSMISGAQEIEGGGFKRKPKKEKKDDKK